MKMLSINLWRRRCLELERRPVRRLARYNSLRGRPTGPRKARHRWPRGGRYGTSVRQGAQVEYRKNLGEKE